MKPRLKQISRWIKYPALIVVIIVATIVLVAYGRGYFYNLETGEIAGGGLLYIDSEPSGARIHINGSNRGVTENQIRLTSDTYTVELSRDGYRSWTKELPVRTAAVTYARYPVLVPNSVPSDPLRNLSGVRFISQSDDQQYLAAIMAGDNGDRVRVFRAGSDRSSYVAFRPPARYDQLTITGVTWAPDTSRVFIQAKSSDGSSRYFVFNPGERQSGRSVERIADTAFQQPVFSQGGEAVYGITARGLLRRIPLNQSPPQTIARNVVAFDVYEDAIYAVRYESGTSRLVRIDDGDVTSLVSYDTTDTYRLRTIQYQDQLYAVLHNTDTDQVTLLRNAASETRTTLSLTPGAAEHMTISPGGQYIVMFSGTQFTTHDLERDQTYRFAVPDLATEPQWYTNHHMLAISQDGAVLFEFDGANWEYLTAAQQFRVFGNHQRDVIYSVRRNQVTGQLQLQRSNLK